MTQNLERFQPDGYVSQIRLSSALAVIKFDSTKSTTRFHLFAYHNHNRFFHLSIHNCLCPISSVYFDI